MFGANVNADAKEHALAMFPNEACGLVVGNAYIPCPNIAEDPTKDFRISDSIVTPFIIAETLQGVIHSHPFEQLSERSCPSSADMRSQIAVNVPYGIIDIAPDVVNDPYWWGKHLLDEPMIGTEFHHGVTDCYTAIRKWYWQTRGVLLPDFARDNLWWLTDVDLYVRNFEIAGFTPVSRHDMQDGDVVIGKVNSTAINHGGVYLDNTVDGKGLMLHHLPGRLSRREPASPWVNRSDLIVRYTGAN